MKDTDMDQVKSMKAHVRRMLATVDEMVTANNVLMAQAQQLLKGYRKRVRSPSKPEQRTWSTLPEALVGGS